MTVTLVQPCHPYRLWGAAKPVLRPAPDFDELTSTVIGRGGVPTEFSLALNEDQLQIQAWVHDFATTVIRPAAQEWDEPGAPPWPIIEEAARVGLYSLDFLANAFGDPSGVLLPVVAEELAWGDFATGLAIFGSGLAVAAIIANGTREQIVEWLPVCFEGDNGKVNLAAFGASEPDVGTGVRSLRSRAVFDDARDEWVLNGTKTFVTNGGVAGVHVVVLSVDPELGTGGQASFVVPPETPGLSIGQNVMNMGIRAPHTVELILEDVRVPGRCLLGGKERLDERLARAHGSMNVGALPATTVFEAFRPAVGAHAVGIARAAYDYALGYAKERKRYGRPLVEDEVIAFKLADMKMRTDAARLLVWRAGWMASAGKPFEAAEGSMSKLYAGENAVWVTDQAIQIASEHSYVRDYPLERWRRDAKYFTIFEGAPESERLRIARAVSGRRVQWSTHRGKHAAFN
jgi:alkylation response protein AidB-like acyl-CoA dehydrogenase